MQPPEPEYPALYPARNIIGPLRSEASKLRALEVLGNHSRTRRRRIRWLTWRKVCVHCGERVPCRQSTWARHELGLPL